MRDHPNYCIVKINQNTEKGPGNLRKLAVTQTPMKNHHRTLVGKSNKKMTKKRNFQNVQNESLQILENNESRQHLTCRDESKMKKKEYLRRTRKLLEIKLYSRNLIKRIRTRAEFLVRYLGTFLRTPANGPENKKINDDTYHNVDRLYVSRKERGRGLISIQDSVDASI